MPQLQEIGVYITFKHALHAQNVIFAAVGGFIAIWGRIGARTFKVVGSDGGV